MTALFLRLTNMGITAGWIVLGLLLVRLLMRKAPKWIACLLWGIVGLYLVLPVTPVSRFSLLPSTQPIPVDIANAQIPRVQTGIPAVNLAVNPLVDKIGDLAGFLEVLTVIWVVGVAAMLLYGTVSYLLLRRKVAPAGVVEPGVYVCDYVDNPFVLGVIRPRIYLPSGMDDACVGSVLAHERAHIQRRDHWWKPLGYTLLAVYWFNPLLWLAYILLCRDIESACDEKVIKTMDIQHRKRYCLDLAQCSVHRVRILACPVAFGEVSVKSRVRAILSYKKPGFWLVAVAAVLCLVAAICFLTAPVPCAHAYTDQITTEATCTEEGVRMYTCSKCNDRYTEPAAMLAHSDDAGQILTEPTCTREGRCLYTCSDCGYQHTEPVAALAHTYGAGEVITPADCVQPGLQKAACTVCGGVAEVPIGINDAHRFTNTVIRKATCVDSGEGINTCTLCGIEENCIYELTEHNYVDGIYIAPNCVRKGNQQKKCTVCDAEYWLELPITKEHRWMRTGISTEERCMFCYAVNPETSPWKYDLLSGDLPPANSNPFPVVEWDLAP